MRINEAQAQATATTDRGDERYSSGLAEGAEIPTAAGRQTKAEVPLTMETVITGANMMLAWLRVVENKGAAGVDERSCEDIGLQQLRSVVERGSQPYESGNKSRNVQKGGLIITAGVAKAVPELT